VREQGQATQRLQREQQEREQEVEVEKQRVLEAARSEATSRQEQLGETHAMLAEVQRKLVGSEDEIAALKAQLVQAELKLRDMDNVQEKIAALDHVVKLQASQVSASLNALEAKERELKQAKSTGVGALGSKLKAAQERINHLELELGEKELEVATATTHVRALEQRLLAQPRSSATAIEQTTPQ